MTYKPTEPTACFPKGLVQPPGSFHFSTDALLLAAFALSPLPAFPNIHGPLWIDLGTGCGIVGLAALRLAGLPHNPDTKIRELFCYGIDCDERLTAAATINARNLGLQQHFTAVTMDFNSTGWPYTARAIHKNHGRAALVFANPPWKLEKTGKIPQTPLRQKALFGTEETFPLFVRTAASLLAPNGRLVCSIGSARLQDMFMALQANSFNILRLRFVHSRRTRTAVWALIEAKRTGKTPLRVEPPLILYNTNGKPTAEVLEFCPFLR